MTLPVWALVLIGLGVFYAGATVFALLSAHDADMANARDITVICPNCGVSHPLANLEVDAA